MRLSLCRQPSGVSCTEGDLYVNGVWECFTLEDVVRAEKIPGKTAIPEGVYRITLENSPKFGPETITVNDVPGFTSIRIHAGNTDADTEGCPLVGLRRGPDSIYDSRKALAALKAKVKLGLEGGGEVFLSVENAPT